MGCLSLARSPHAHTFSVIHIFAAKARAQVLTLLLYGTPRAISTVAPLTAAPAALPDARNDCGVAYALDSTGQETVLYTFAKTAGRKSEGGLIQESKGNLYSTTLLWPRNSVA
jgi:hypothetical protein